MDRIRRTSGIAVLLASLPSLLLAQPVDDARARGLEMAAAGLADQAYELLAPWVDEHPKDLEARSTLAVVAAQSGRFEKAEELLQGLPDDDPRMALLGADLALGRGEARVAIGRLAHHRESPPPALEREFKRILGQAYVEIGQPSLALEVLGTVEADPVLSLTRARALFQSGLLEGARDELRPFAEQILRLGVENAPTTQRALMADILVHYARALMGTGQAVEAVSVLEPNVVALNHRRAWNVLAQALVAAGRGDEARAALNRGAALTHSATGPADERK